MQILFKSEKFEVRRILRSIVYTNIFLFLFREAEQMKYLYERLNQATLLNDSNRFYQRVNREFAPLEPRRSNPLDRYQLPE
jgi:hypothetical protein